MKQVKPTVHSHLHLCQTLFRGMAENRTLIPWLEDRIWPLEAAHTPETLAVSVILSLREIISTGSTGLLDMGSVKHSTTTVDILKESRIRAVACNALMDRGPEFIIKPLNWLVEESEKTQKSCGGLVQYGLAPRFILSCSPELWQWLETKDENTVRTTHAAEAPGEMADSWIAKHGGNIHLLNSLNFLSPRTLLAHCVHLQPGEMEVLKQTKTAVAHCPWTNLYLGSGIADVPELLKNNITVLLGSDGAPCNNRLDLSGETRLAAGLASVKSTPGTIDSSRWTAMSGTDAADFFNFSNFRNDEVYIDLTETEQEELELAQDKQRYLNEIPRAGRVAKLVCNGTTLYDHGEFPTLPKLPMSIKQAREVVWNRALSLGMKP
ncbi:MAG: amidohydrolase family protein [Candidatus Fermentibacteraceae bacterium]|nr:amidohydrolase family protein [Candidatus Fermentibacteraceae bacterium]